MNRVSQLFMGSHLLKPVILSGVCEAKDLTSVLGRRFGERIERSISTASKCPRALQYFGLYCEIHRFVDSAQDDSRCKSSRVRKNETSLIL